MAKPYKILNAATATGAGSAFDLGDAASVFTMQVVLTGAPATDTTKLEGSLDGTNWFDLTGLTLSAAGAVTNSADAGVHFATRYVRANVTTLTGGTAPTVSVWLAVNSLQK